MEAIKAPEVEESVQHLSVKQQSSDTTEPYEFNFFSVVNLTFGALDGILNAMPKGGLLSQCGINLKAQRTLYINATN